MKQQILNLKKKLLIVEIPDNHHAIAVFPRSSFLTTWDKDNYTYTNKLDFDVEETGKLTDITEEQLSGVIDELNHKGSHLFLNRKDSLFAVLEATGIYFKNPLDATDIKLETGDLGVDDAEWQEAEQKVWDISRCHLFQII